MIRIWSSAGGKTPGAGSREFDPGLAEEVEDVFVEQARRCLTEWKDLEAEAATGMEESAEANEEADKKLNDEL